jgi:hypothetical protein
MTASGLAWIVSARFDTVFILMPAPLVSLFAVLFSDQISQIAEMPGVLWLILIVGIDAGHVYSTLFRTYWVRDELHQRQSLLILTPILAWLLGCLLYSIGSLVFWRVLAYLALFHFIRQQYGFMMIYGRNERNPPAFYKAIDKAAIYLATLYPVIYWHCHERAFDWFVADDFLKIDSSMLADAAAWLYVAVLLLYVLKELKYWIQSKTINVAKHLVLMGTGLSWYVGIVAFNNDLIFTATNIIAHGLPYYALIWAYGYKQSQLPHTNDVYVLPWLSRLYSKKAAVLYVALLFALAFVEEGFWDGLIWREHGRIFVAFNLLPSIESPQTLTWLIPLLALPQTTHYLLDAFIWRLHRTDTQWKNVLFHQSRG